MASAMAQGTATSADGTAIGYRRLGSGPGLVIVHGSLTTGNEWLTAASVLARHFTCFLMDRRGRGRSADSADYSIEKERQDIAAVLERAGPDAFLLGHSYGAICALEYARVTPVPKLILYEPPLPIHGTIIGPAFAKFRAAVEAREFDQALSIGLQAFVRMPEPIVAGLRQTALWSEMAALTPTWPRECEVIEALEHGVERFSNMQMPILLILGSTTAPHHKEATQALAAVLPNATLLEFPGHGHQAHVTATDEFAAAVHSFLAAED